MKFIFVISLFVMAALAKPVDEIVAEFYNIEEAAKLFDEYVKNYQKEYKDDDDRQVHYEAFVANLKFINEGNEEYKKGNRTYTLGVNQFSDFTDEERKNFFGGGVKQPKD